VLVDRDVLGLVGLQVCHRASLVHARAERAQQCAADTLSLEGALDADGTEMPVRRLRIVPRPGAGPTQRRTLPASGHLSELDEGRRRASELETIQAERTQAAKLQDALYRIAELAGAAEDMQEFYRSIHAVVSELMYANNFFIALYDDDRQLISWPYYVDELDDDVPEPNQWDAFGEGDAKGSTAYVLRTGEPQLLPYERTLELVAQGEIEIRGAATEDSSWLGVPLKAEDRTLGVAAVQSYTRDVQYTERDMELLAIFARQATTAITAARVQRDTVRLLREVLRQIADESMTDEQVEDVVSKATEGLDDDPDAGPFWRLVDHVALMRGLGERDINLIGEILEVVARHAQRARRRA